MQLEFLLKIGSFLLDGNLTPFTNKDFHNFLMGSDMLAQARQDFSQGGKKLKFDGVKFISQTVIASALISLEASEAQSFAYCPTERKRDGRL